MTKTIVGRSTVTPIGVSTFLQPAISTPRKVWKEHVNDYAHRPSNAMMPAPEIMQSKDKHSFLVLA